MNADVILDFNYAEGDRIDVTDVDANSVLFGKQAGFDFIGEHNTVGGFTAPGHKRPRPTNRARNALTKGVRDKSARVQLAVNLPSALKEITSLLSATVPSHSPTILDEYSDSGIAGASPEQDDNPTANRKRQNERRG
jgi:hypothetical protein